MEKVQTYPAVLLMLLVLLLLLLSNAVQSTPGVEEQQDTVSNLSVEPKYNMIDASWMVQNPSDELFWYEVAWVSDDDRTGGWCWASPSNGSSQTHTTAECQQIPSLKSCTLYNVIIFPMTSNYNHFGVPESKSCRTLAKAPPNPTNLQSFFHLGNQSIVVSWTKPDTACPISKYLISWSGEETGHESTHIGGDQLQHSIRGAAPNTIYKICVTGQTRELVGNETCRTVNTKIIPPKKLSLTLELLQATSNSLTVRWNQPEDISSSISGYIVKWKNQDGLETPTDFPEHSTTLQDVNKWESFHDYTIRGLKSDQSYTVSVQATLITDGGARGDGVFKTLPTDNSAEDGGNFSVGIPAAAIAISLTLVIVVVVAVVLRRKNRREAARTNVSLELRKEKKLPKNRHRESNAMQSETSLASSKPSMTSVLTNDQAAILQ